MEASESSHSLRGILITVIFVRKTAIAIKTVPAEKHLKCQWIPKAAKTTKQDYKPLDIFIP